MCHEKTEPDPREEYCARHEDRGPQVEVPDERTLLERMKQAENDLRQFAAAYIHAANSVADRLSRIERVLGVDSPPCPEYAPEHIAWVGTNPNEPGQQR